jgi:hypothetical protein
LTSKGYWRIGNAAAVGLGSFLVEKAKLVNANASTFKFWQSPVSIAANDEFALAA